MIVPGACSPFRSDDHVRSSIGANPINELIFSASACVAGL
jgi:hypothetical protein